MNEDYENAGFFKRNFIWFLVLVAVVVFGLLLFNGWDQVVNDTVDNMSTVTGKFSCLPLQEGATSSEACALGVKSRDGSYYALDISRIQDANMDLKAEDTIAVTGFMMPSSEVNSSKWRDYQIQGVMKVNTLLRTR